MESGGRGGSGWGTNAWTTSSSPDGILTQVPDSRVGLLGKIVNQGWALINNIVLS